MRDHEITIYNVIGCLLVIPFLAAGLYLCVALAYPGDTTYNWEHNRITLKLFFSLLTVVSIILIWIIFRLRVMMLEHHEKYTQMLKTKEIECEKKIRNIKNDFEAKLSFQKRINTEMSKVIKSKTPFREVAALFADFETSIYEKDEKYLRYKPRRAPGAANTVKAIRKAYRDDVEKYKIMQYKYDFILNLFPEIQAYIDDEESLVEMANYTSYDDVRENMDNVKLWLSSEEYAKLPVDTRNQLALDRYKNRPKNRWEIGIEYELYIGYLLREGKTPFDKRFHVIQFGELNGVHDLGRDIIAETDDAEEGKTVYVIQCKRWSDQKVIHENAICQLFGTAMEYQIKHSELNNCKFIPMFITTTELSPMAEEFAKQLNVQVKKIPMGEYPMIKCNINGVSKIYHLPFDQQYHRTEITNEGEFYAFTVAEAVSKGFRRAMRHFN